MKHVVYDDGVIAVGLVSSPHGPHLASLALRWLEPQPYKGQDGQLVETTNLMGGETDWFIIPATLGAAIGRNLLEQRAATTDSRAFDEAGFAALVEWLVANEELTDAMCY